MSDLKRTLSEAVQAAFADLGLPAELGRVTASDRPDLADFQSNGALAAAKRVGKNPRELATAVAGRLSADPRLVAVEVAGPGSSICRWPTPSSPVVARRSPTTAAPAARWSRLRGAC